MAKNNYDPAHEGELAARRDAYRMAQKDNRLAKLTDDERLVISKAIRNLSYATQQLHHILACDNRNKLSEAEKEMTLRYEINDTVEIALGQIKNLL